MRLIEADLLKKDISKLLKPTGKPDETEFVKLDDIAVSTLITIEEQPTAYDVEKVVEQLRVKAFERYGNDGMGGELVVNLDDVMDILIGGGADEISN